MSARNIIAKILADTEIADMRRADRSPYFRPPVIRPWGVATGARPRRIRARPEVVGIIWLVLLLLAVGSCSAAFFWL